MVSGLRMVAGSGGRWHVQRVREGMRYGKTLAVSSLSFLSRVSLMYQETVNPGLGGSEEEAPGDSSHVKHGACPEEHQPMKAADDNAAH